MEDVLDVYMRPYDPRRPLVCLDEIVIASVIALLWFDGVRFVRRRARKHNR
jgi:hypothetical protein